MTDDSDPLDHELANLKKLNGVLEKVLTALDASSINTEKVNNTVQNADKLLDLWIRVLARSDQAQKLILDGRWQGATNDLQAIEFEQSQAYKIAQEEQQARLRREQEDMEARERKDREDRERLLSSSATSLTTRGRGVSSGARGRSVSGTTRGGTVKKEVRKEPVSVYAQRPATTRPQASTSSTTARTSTIPSVGFGRGRGVPVVRGTRASHGRQQGLGRSTGEPAAFR